MRPGLWIALAAGTVFFLAVTWFVSVRDKRYHGFPRFFAFESVFLLILLNGAAWFRDPFSLRQIAAWLSVLASVAVVSAGLFALMKFGKPRSMNFENTTRLVDEGIFHYIRHPMYASLILLGIGAFLKGIRPVTAVILVVALAACGLTAWTEEREMAEKFGPAYRDYMKRTKRFVPFVL